MWIDKKRHGYSFNGIAARMVLRRRCSLKNKKTINVKRLTILAAMPSNDRRDFIILEGV